VKRSGLVRRGKPIISTWSDPKTKSSFRGKEEELKAKHKHQIVIARDNNAAADKELPFKEEAGKASVHKDRGYRAKAVVGAQEPKVTAQSKHKSADRAPKVWPKGRNPALPEKEQFSDVALNLEQRRVAQLMRDSIKKGTISAAALEPIYLELRGTKMDDTEARKAFLRRKGIVPQPGGFAVLVDSARDLKKLERLNATKKYWNTVTSVLEGVVKVARDHYPELTAADIHDWPDMESAEFGALDAFKKNPIGVAHEWASGLPKTRKGKEFDRLAYIIRSYFPDMMKYRNEMLLKAGNKERQMASRALIDRSASMRRSTFNVRSMEPWKRRFDEGVDYAWGDEEGFTPRVPETLWGTGRKLWRPRVIYVVDEGSGWTKVVREPVLRGMSTLGPVFARSDRLYINRREHNRRMHSLNGNTFNHRWVEPSNNQQPGGELAWDSLVGRRPANDFWKMCLQYVPMYVRDEAGNNVWGGNYVGRVKSALAMALRDGGSDAGHYFYYACQHASRTADRSMKYFNALVSQMSDKVSRETYDAMVKVLTSSETASTMGSAYGQIFQRAFGRAHEGMADARLHVFFALGLLLNQTFTAALPEELLKRWGKWTKHVFIWLEFMAYVLLYKRQLGLRAMLAYRALAVAMHYVCAAMPLGKGILSHAMYNVVSLMLFPAVGVATGSGKGAKNAWRNPQGPAPAPVDGKAFPPIADGPKGPVPRRGKGPRPAAPHMGVPQPAPAPADAPAAKGAAPAPAPAAPAPKAPPAKIVERELKKDILALPPAGRDIFWVSEPGVPLAVVGKEDLPMATRASVEVNGENDHVFAGIVAPEHKAAGRVAKLGSLLLVLYRIWSLVRGGRVSLKWSAIGSAAVGAIALVFFYAMKGRVRQPTLAELDKLRDVDYLRVHIRPQPGVNDADHRSYTNSKDELLGAYCPALVTVTRWDVRPVYITRIIANLRKLVADGGWLKDPKVIQEAHLVEMNSIYGNFYSPAGSDVSSLENARKAILARCNLERTVDIPAMERHRAAQGNWAVVALLAEAATNMVGYKQINCSAHREASSS